MNLDRFKKNTDRNTKLTFHSSVTGLILLNNALQGNGDGVLTIMRIPFIKLECTAHDNDNESR